MKTHQNLAVAALLSFASIAAHAGISECVELKEPGIMEQRDKCVAHAACNFVLTSKPDCAKAKLFLERTQGNVLNQITSLFNRRKAMTANDVYEADLPDVDYPQEWQDRFAAIREKVLASGADVQSGTNNDGSSWIYQGDVREGKREGWGVFFWSSGAMYRGQFAQDWRTGKGDYAAANGYRGVGMYVNNELNGDAWVRLSNGVQKKGGFSKGKLEGTGSYLFPNGNLYSGNFINDDFNGAGIYRWADGSSFEGNFTNDKLDGQGTYTSPSGEKSSRTYAAGKMLAGESPVAAAPVSPTAACNDTLKTCSTICAAGGVIGLLLSSRKADTSASQKCIDECSSNHQQCLAGAAPGVGSPSTIRPGQTDTAGRQPDARCAFAKLHLGFYASNNTYVDTAVFQLRVLPLRFSYGSKERLQAHYEGAAKSAANVGLGGSVEQRAVNELAARSIREWKDTLTCIEENGEFMLDKGEDMPQMSAYPKEWMGRKDKDLPQTLSLSQSVPRGAPDWNDYPWKACELIQLGMAKEGGLRQVVLNRTYDSTGLHSRFMLGSQLAYLRGVYAELMGESALSASLRSMNPDPRTIPAGRRALAELKDAITGLECEEARGFPLSAEATFVKSYGRNPKRYPGTQIPRCTTAQSCASIRSE